MAERSYFEVSCVCGAVNRPHDRVSRCAAWGRTLELHWPAEMPATMKQEAAHAKSPRDPR